MKKFLTILFCLLSAFSYSQTFVPTQIQTGPYFYNTDSVLLYLPPSYGSGSTRYPMVEFYPGVGEEGNMAALQNTGLPQLIAGGQVPRATYSGTAYEFIVVVFKNNIGFNNHEDAFGHANDWLFSHYRVDTSRVYATGLSKGSESAVSEAVAQNARIAAIYPVAFTEYSNQPPDQDSIKTSGSHGIPLWTVTGSNDVTEPQNSFNKSITLVNDYNTNNPSPLGIRTVIAGADHSSALWNVAYDTAWRANSNNTVVHLNMYEWFLQYHRTFVSGGGNTPAPPSNLIVDDNLNTLDWTYSPLFTTSDKYEFTEDSGYTYMMVREKPVHIGNVGLKTGYVGVRVKSINGDPTSSTIYSTSPYTQVVPVSTPSIITITVTLTGSPKDTTKLIPAHLKYNKLGRFGITNDDRRLDALDIASYMTGQGIVSRAGFTYSGKTYTDGANVRGKTIYYTGSVATNSWKNADSTQDASGGGTGMNWAQTVSLVNVGWSLLEHGAWHGIGLQGPTALGFNTLMNATANRDYTYRQTNALGVPYVLKYGVVPTNDPNYHAAWEQLGYTGGSSESTSDGYPDVIQEWQNYGLYPVDSWLTDNRYKVHLRNFKELQTGYTAQALIDRARQLSLQASPTNHLSVEYGCHGVTWDTLTKAIDSLAFYSQDNMWICGLQEFTEYFQTYQQTGIKQSLSGNILTVTLDQTFLPDATRWRDMSFLLSSNSAISSVAVSGADDYSYNTSTGLINIYKKKTSGFIPPESALNNGFVFHGKVPLEGNDLYIDNNYDNKPSPLVDGDTTTLYHVKTYDGAMLYTPYDVVVDLSDYGVVVDKVKVRLGSANGYTTKVILVRNDNETEDSIGVFTGASQNQWLTFYPDTTLKFVSSKLILRSDQSNGYGTEVQVFGDYLPYTEQVYPNRKTPLKYELGTNAHWWNFVNNATGSSTALVTNKVMGFDSLHLHSLRNYGNAVSYQDSTGAQFGFNPTVGGGWFEDLFMRRLKSTNPDLIRWSVLQGQTTAVSKTWNVADTSWWVKATVTSYVIHSPSWGTLTLSSYAHKGSGTFTHNYIKVITGTGRNDETSNDLVGATDATITLNIDGTGGFNVGDALWIQGRHTSALNYNYGNDRSVATTWDSVARLAYFWSARKGKNLGATHFIPFQPHNVGIEDNNDSVGIQTSEWTELMNEPTAYWAGYDEYLNGKHLGLAWSKIYDNNKTYSTFLGSRNADTSMKVSTSGLAVNEPDVVRSADSWGRRNRSNRAKTNVAVQPYNWKARTFGWVDNPYDVIQFHNYSSTSGANQFGGGVQAGLPPEAGIALNAVNDFVWFRNKYAPWASVDVGEWGYDVNQSSNMNVPPIAPYNAEQTRGAWSIRTMLEYNAHGIDYAQWYRLYQDSEADSSNSTQFATMSLLKENGDGTISRRIVGNYFRQLDEFGDYAYDSTLREDSIVVYRFKKDTNYLYSVHRVERITTPGGQKPTFTNVTGTYNLPLANGTAITIRTLQDNDITMGSIPATVSGTSYPVAYDLKPVFIQVGSSSGGGRIGGWSPNNLRGIKARFRFFFIRRY